jgi:hypothetical protein
MKIKKKHVQLKLYKMHFGCRSRQRETPDINQLTASAVQLRELLKKIKTGKVFT